MQETSSLSRILIFGTSKRRRVEVHIPDLIWYFGLKAAALFVIVVLMVIVASLWIASEPAMKAFGWRFFFTDTWDPVKQKFGAVAFAYGTLLSSAIALAIAVPISVGAALFLTELAPRFLRAPIGFLIEMLAAIPSVVYGLWGIFVLAPFMRSYIQPWLSQTFGFLPLFQGYPFGIGMLTAGVILAFMIIPTISAISREVFLSIPTVLKEGALGLGATRWEMIRIAVLRPGLSGVLGAIILGLGRALGETMAVTMVIGNKAHIALSLFEPGASMASVIANEYAEANNTLHLSSLAAIGLSLFIISIAVNALARVVIWRVNQR